MPAEIGLCRRGPQWRRDPTAQESCACHSGLGLSNPARNDRGLSSEEEREQRRRVVAPVALAVIGPTIGITLVVIAAGRLRIIAAGRLRVIAAVVAVGARITGSRHRAGGVIVVLALVGRQ